MTVKNGVKKIGAIAAFALGIAIASQTGASASPAEVTDLSPAVVAAPAVSVTPSSNLTSGDTVQLSGTGLTPGEVYFVGQCAAIAPMTYACNDATNSEVVANSSGAITASVVVVSAFTGTTGTGATHAVDCDTSSCVVAAYSASFEGGAVPISFQ